MNLTRAISLFSLSCCMLFTACKKDEVDQFTEDELSIDGGWSISSIETNLDEQAPAIAGSVSLSDLGGIDPSVYEMFLKSQAEELEMLDDCRKDDAYLYYRTGELGFKNKGTICEFGGEDDSDSLFKGSTTWSLNGDQLTFRDDNGTISYSIFSIIGKEMIWEKEETFYDPTLDISTSHEIRTVIKWQANN